MSHAAQTCLYDALRIDFTKQLAGFQHESAFDAKLMETIRRAGAGKTIVLVDHDVSGALEKPALVRDHINLTGTNPLLGPNDPCGDRFPVVQGVYIDDVLGDLPRVVVAGLKAGVSPDADERKLIERLGAQCSCYNIVPAMLAAAHARCRVLAIVLPKGKTMPDGLRKQLEELLGGTI